MAWRFLTALATPLIILVVAPAAALVALGFYLLAIGHGFWLLCRALPRWIRGVSDRTAPRKPHFLATRSPTRMGD